MPRQPDATIGDRIRARRQLRGWSIRFVADRAGLANSTWGRIERGLLGADNRFTLAAIAEALECPVSDLTGQPLAPVDRATAEAQAGVEAIRQALIEVDLDEDPVCAPRPIEELAREAQLVADLRRRCDYTGTGRLLPGLIRELHAAAHGPDKERALRLIVDAMFAAAGVVRYLGSPAESWVAAERCRQAALRLEDPVLIALAEYERSHAATGCGTYRRGLTIAVRAADRLEPRTGEPGGTEMLGQLHLTVAFAATGAKEPAEVTTRIAEAAQLAERTGETTTLGLMFGPTNVNFWQVSMEVDGGDPGQALEIARGTNPALVASPSRQVAFYTDTARALSRVRKDDRAVRMLLAAERISPARVHASPLVHETARVLLDRAQRRAGGPELRGLCERMGIPA
jgi:transcriptional regulator with XRE-family HTH domain